MMTTDILKKEEVIKVLGTSSPSSHQRKLKKAAATSKKIYLWHSTITRRYCVSSYYCCAFKIPPNISEKNNLV